MKRTQTAWAIQRPDQVIVTSMIRATRREAIDLYRDHMMAYQLGDPWTTAYRRGFRAVEVTVSPVGTACTVCADQSAGRG